MESADIESELIELLNTEQQSPPPSTATGSSVDPEPQATDLPQDPPYEG